MENLKQFITGFLVRWLLKVGGGYFIAIGVTENILIPIIGGIISILAGIIISLFQQNKALNMESPLK